MDSLLIIYLFNQLLKLSTYVWSSYISTTSIYVLYFASVAIVVFIFAVTRTLLIARARSVDEVSGNPLVKVVLNSLPYLKVIT